MHGRGRHALPREIGRLLDMVGIVLLDKMADEDKARAGPHRHRSGKTTSSRPSATSTTPSVEKLHGSLSFRIETLVRPTRQCRARLRAPRRAAIAPPCTIYAPSATIPTLLDAALGRRGLAPAAAGLLALDERRRALIAEAQAAQTRRNEASKLIGQSKARATISAPRL